MAVARLTRTYHPPPQRRGGEPGALRHGGDPVPVARRLPGEQEDAARPQHPQELGERAVELRQVVEDRMTEHEVEGRVLERELRRVACDRLHLDAETLRVGLEGREHPR